MSFTFPGGVENKYSYGFLRLLNIFKSVLQIMIGVLCGMRPGVAAQVSLPFPGEKWVAWQSENIENL